MRKLLSSCYSVRNLFEKLLQAANVAVHTMSSHAQLIGTSGRSADGRVACRVFTWKIKKVHKPSEEKQVVLSRPSTVRHPSLVIKSNTFVLAKKKLEETLRLSELSSSETDVTEDRCRKFIVKLCDLLPTYYTKKQSGRDKGGRQSMTGCCCEVKCRWKLSSAEKERTGGKGTHTHRTLIKEASIHEQDQSEREREQSPPVSLAKGHQIKIL